MADALCRLPRVLLDGRPAARALLCGSNAHPRPTGRGAVLSLPGRNPIADTRPGAAGMAFMPATFTRSATAAPGATWPFTAPVPTTIRKAASTRTTREISPSCSPAAAGRSPSCIPADFSPGRCWAGRWYSTLCPTTTAVSPPAPPGAALPAASSPLWPEPARMACHGGPAFCSLFIYCILFCYPTVTTRTTASPPSAPL